MICNINMNAYKRGWLFLSIYYIIVCEVTSAGGRIEKRKNAHREHVSRTVTFNETINVLVIKAIHYYFVSSQDQKNTEQYNEQKMLNHQKSDSII